MRLTREQLGKYGIGYCNYPLKFSFKDTVKEFPVRECRIIGHDGKGRFFCHFYSMYNKNFYRWIRKKYVFYDEKLTKKANFDGLKLILDE